MVKILIETFDHIFQGYLIKKHLVRLLTQVLLGVEKPLLWLREKFRDYLFTNHSL